MSATPKGVLFPGSARVVIGSILLLTLGGSPSARAQLRVMTHNVTNYSGGRVSDFQTAYFADFQGCHARPDVFVAQEVISPAALSTLLTAMNTAPGSPGDYASASFIDGPDTDSVCIYRTSKVVLDGEVIVSHGGTSPEPPRNTMRYDMHLKGYSGNLARLSVYSVHLKAGSAQSDKDRRNLECQRVRTNATSLGHPFLIAGDFNVQSSSEPSYVQLVGSQTNNTGRFFDPILTPGAWNNNATYRFVHTQDPTPGQSGGMDDRFDFVLLSSSLVDGSAFDYLGDVTKPYSTVTWNDANHSYRAWGNDGTSFNSSLSVANNQMVGPAIAQAIINTTQNMSGHIPVFLDLLVPPKASNSGDIDFGKLVVGQFGAKNLLVMNTGDVDTWTTRGIADLKLSLSASPGFSVPIGQFSVPAGQGLQLPVTVDTGFPGIMTGTVTITSDDPDNPVQTVNVRANVHTLTLTGPKRID